MLDIETFRKIEEILENCGLARYMEEGEGEGVLSLNEAQQYYAQVNYPDLKVGACERLSRTKQLD